MPSPPTSPERPSMPSRLDSHEGRPGRQRPGNSCLECRTKKLKCDGQLPRCGKCQISGSDCTPATQTPRGPKKGHLRVLQNRIDSLEQEVVQLRKHRSEVDAVHLGPDSSLGHLPDSLFDLHDMRAPALPFSPDDPLLQSIIIAPHPITPAPTIDVGPSPTQVPPLSDSLDALGGCMVSGDLVNADLNELYFERVQQSFPFLHRRRYFAWAHAPVKTPAQICLQHAMWTVAASLTSHLADMHQSLYQSAMQAMDAIEHKPDTFASIEHVQASFLLCVYEMMRKNFRRGFMSAGRLFRLVQLTCLHEIDSPGNTAQRKASPSCESWLQLEEKRRTFWLAYVLDLSNSVWGYWRSTLHEQTIYTALPMPEDHFQNETYLEMPCLVDPMQDLQAPERSSLTDCILVATICRRISLHQHRFLADRTGSRADHQTIWAWHEQLGEFLQTHARSLLQQSSASPQLAEPLVHFASMMTHALVLCLCEVLESTIGTNSEFQTDVGSFRQRSVQAAQRILESTQYVSSPNYLKMHPLTPLPLCICAEFFESQRHVDSQLDSPTQTIFSILREIGYTNNLAQEYLVGQKNRHSRTR